MALTWRWEDSRGNRAITDAIARARAKAWDTDRVSMSTGTRVEDLRALMAATAYVTLEYCGQQPPQIAPEQGYTLDLRAANYRDPAALQFAGPLLSYTSVLALGAGIGEPPANASYGPSGSQTGLVWLTPAVALIMTAGAAAVLIWVAVKAVEVIDRKLARDAAYRELAATHATALQALHEHAERERAAGKALPPTQMEAQLSQSLATAEKTAIDKITSEKPLSTGLFAGLAEAAVPIAVIVGGIVLFKFLK